eukprot:882752_1
MNSRFYPTVEKFTLMELTMSYKFYTEATSIQLEVGNAFSVQKIYRTSACAVPSFFAYVSVTKGVALSVTWDENACSLCGSSDCVDDNCCTPHSTCLTSVDCDIKIYLGWSGTDINDATLQSKDPSQPPTDESPLQVTH